ncbi:MAG TPA: hypothetical protein VNN73_08255 [Blastocatellia bacterium]|nr:hypothetical protein [Blastocatellia bacterium]
MPQQGPSRGNPIQDYITVAERIEKFYERYPEGRIITHIVEHDAERGFILMRAEVYRNADDALPAATGHAYELKTEGYVQRTSYIEVGETSAVGRALAMAGFEVKRGIASREEMEKTARMTRDAQPATPAPREREPGAPALPSKQGDGSESKANQPATEDQKQSILGLLESLRPGDRRAQRRVLVEMTGKESRDDLTQQEAADLIVKLKREATAREHLEQV